MPQKGIDGLEHFVSPGQLEDPFGTKTGSTSDTGRHTKVNFTNPRRSYVPSQTPPRPTKTLERNLASQITSKRPDSAHPARPANLPTYYVSSATRRLIAEKVQAEPSLVGEQLPQIFEMAVWISKTMGRDLPTFSDMEAAFEFRTEDQLEQVGKGQAQVSLTRWEPTQGNAMSEKQLRMYWMSFASAVLKFIRQQRPSVPDES